VLAFEPHPRIFGYLRDNVRRNGLRHVELCHAAVGSEPGVATISDQRVDDENQILVQGDGLPVTVVTLDEAAAHLPGIALLKIDVEGYELAVLEGAAGSLARTACVYFELSERMAARYGYAPGRLLECLEASGFRLFRRVRGSDLEAIDSTYALVEPVENTFAIRDITDFERRTGWQIR
jgi:FkbM family methyltransferase